MNGLLVTPCPNKYFEVLSRHCDWLIMLSIR